MSFSTVSLAGRLASDPELRFLGSGTAIVNFSVCVERREKKNEQWESVPHFFDCTCFGKRGETLNKFHRKGTPISLTGELRQERWEDKQTGGKRSRVSILVNDFTLPPRSESQQGGPPPQQRQQQQPPQPPQQYQPQQYQSPQYEPPRGPMAGEETPF